jgi:hypothetical protein
MAFGIIYGILNYSCPRFFNSSVKMGLHEAHPSTLWKPKFKMEKGMECLK